MTSAFRGLKNLEGPLRFQVVDAKGQVVGRLANQIARVLMGKDKPTFSPSKDEGDIVVVINAKDIEFTGRKWDQKLYRHHSGYPGGLKERTAKLQHEKDPTAVLKNAVNGMLPKNNLRKRMMTKLRIYSGPDHAYKHLKDGGTVVLREERNYGQNGERKTAQVIMSQLRIPERKLRVKEPLFVLPEGFEPFNPEAYYKRYGRRLEKLQSGSTTVGGSIADQQQS